MEQQNLWLGSRAEPPGNVPLQDNVDQLPPLLSSSVERHWTPTQRQPISRRHRAAHPQGRSGPMESLAQRLRRQSLRSRDDVEGDWQKSSRSAPRSECDRMLQAFQRYEDNFMDVDKDLNHSMDMSRTIIDQAQAETERGAGQSSCEVTEYIARLSDQIRPNKSQLHIQASPSPSPPAMLLSPTSVAGIPPVPSLPITPVDNGYPASLEVDAAEATTCDLLDVDEGYEEGAEEMSWTIDRHSIICNIAHARNSGVLKFRTSSEAAMQCPQIVRKTPRMRRRRQKKHESRIRASSTASTCGPDKQNINTITPLES